MKIFVPYTWYNPDTYKCLQRYEYTPVRMIKDTDYYAYFKQRWAEGDSFINCEHDTVFWDGAIESLEQCPEGWCAFATDENVDFRRSSLPPLALAKFSDSFIQQYPDIWDNPDWAEWPGVPMWQILDAWLHRHAGQRGVRCHQHFPSVINANPVKNVVEILSTEGA